MASPRIGRSSEKPDKPEALKVADNLAAQSRMLRRAYATEQEAINAAIAAMRGISDAKHVERKQEKQQIAEEAQVKFAPYIAEAKKIVSENAAAEREARPLIEALDSLDRKAIVERFNSGHGVTVFDQEKGYSATDATRVSRQNTRDRLAWVFRLVDEAKELLRGNDNDLRSAIKTCEGITVLGSHEGALAKSTILQYIKWAGDRAVLLRSKIGGIRRTLNEISEAIVTQGTPDGPAEPMLVQVTPVIDGVDLRQLREMGWSTTTGATSSPEAN